MLELYLKDRNRSIRWYAEYVRKAEIVILEKKIAEERESDRKMENEREMANKKTL